MGPRKMCHSLLWLSALCLCALGAEFDVVPPLEMDEKLDMAVDSDGQVFLSVGSRLLRLDRELSLAENVTVNSPILQIALSYDGTKLVACFVDESCAVYVDSSFRAGPLMTVELAAASALNLALFTSPNDTFYVGSEGSLPGLTNVIYLTQYGFGGNQVKRTSDSDFDIQTSGFDRIFAGGFTQGVYAYYVSFDSTSQDLDVRVERVCNEDTCGSQCAEFGTMFEAELPCGILSAGQTICGVSLVDGFLGSADPTLVYSVCGPRNHICSVPLASIDAEIDATYNECSAPDSTHQIDVAWDMTGGSSSTCDMVGTFVSECEHDPLLPLTLNNFNAIGTSILYNFDSDSSVDALTATLVIAVDDVTLLYVGYCDGSEHFVAALHVQGTTTVENINGAFNSIDVSSPVVELHWREGLDYIYAASEDSVFQIPLEQCSQIDDCQSCTASPNPLCGWCTVEQKCSRQMQCQNSTEPLRWVQDGAECISSSLTPDQFVLGIGQNVSVTVSASLPTPFSGESYRCQFDSLNLTTPATTVDGVNYTCELNGNVPSFDGAMLMSDFSFVSSLINVPFATEEDAITFYSCPAATSCTECVETNNACGWCIYNKICRGTADECTSANETYWLRLGEAGGSEEVCPLLLPSTTPTEDYVQPVLIDRDLQLITRNLRQPPSNDFRYECKLATSPELTLSTVYTNETSITCLVDANQITLPGGTGQQTVDITLEWVRVSDPLRHTIDTQAMVPVNTTLYSCADLGDRCSVCLAANTATGFDCAWCGGTACEVESQCSGDITTTFMECPDPTITAISPTSGPPTGGTTITLTGTDLGVTYADVVGNVYLGPDNSTRCNTSRGLYVPGVQIGCVTPDLGDQQTPFTLVVRVELESGNATGPDFTVDTPRVVSVVPGFGPVDGGVVVSVQGENLAIGNTDNTRVTFNGTDCTSTEVLTEEDRIECTTEAFSGVSSPCDPPPSSDEQCDMRQNRTFTATEYVRVIVDGSPFPIESDVAFTYRCNPTVYSVSPQNTIPAGGITLTFRGCDTDVVGDPVLVVSSGGVTRRDTSSVTCVSTRGRTVECVMPPVNLGAPVDYTLLFGNHAVQGVDNLEVSVNPNPNFGADGLRTAEINTGGSSQLIVIDGENLDSVDHNLYMVFVDSEPCTSPSTPDDGGVQVLQCTAPNIPAGTTALVVVFVGNLNFSVGSVQYVEADGGSSGPDYLVIGAAVGGAVVVIGLTCFLIIIIIICGYNSKARQKDKQLTNLLAQMELWEIEMADECKKAFTELQTDLADLVQISDKNLPYRDFRSFAMRFLFPNSGESHPVLMPFQVPPGYTHEQAMQHLMGFRHLVMEKKFLLVFVRTLEAQEGRFTLQDKCNVASLLMVAFQNDLDYATDILHTLLTELMRRAVSKSHPKLLLRATETVAEKMLANWLCFLLYPYILEHAGEPLFILYRAIKSQLEKGPVDVITGDARHSLSEEKLLRQHRDVKIVEGVVETEGDEEVPIKLLDCDSVTQAKEKILDAIYKNTPVSKRPQLTEVDLELRTTGGITLRDQDQTNLKDGEWTIVNTLGHYKLDEMSQAAIENPKKPQPRFRLVQRPQRPVSGMSFDTLGTIIANMGSDGHRASLLPSELSRVYHLVKPESGEGDEAGPHQGARIMSEVFLTRLLSTKQILQSYVDNLFHSIFAIPRGRPLPKAIKYLFDFLDLQAAELGITDSEVLHTWKTNSVPLRFWVNVLKNPDFIFDINKSATMDSCLTVITQAYIDACSTSDLRYSKDTPSGRLLYVKDVPRYKAEVHQYYETIQSLPKLDPREMQEYLRETAQVCAASQPPLHAADQPDNSTRQLYFVTESALYELYKFASHYSDEMMEALNDDGLITLAAKFGELTQSFKVKS